MLHRVRRTCLLVSALAFVWSSAVAIYGGVVWDLGWFTVSSRNPRNPFLLSLIALAASFALAPAGQRVRLWAIDWSWAKQRPVALCPTWLRARLSPNVVAATLALATSGFGILTGAHVAGAADSYGYVSEARMLASGRLFVEQPHLQDLPAGVPKEVLIPHGYRLSPARDVLVPTYSPGFPMVMALFEWIGGPDAVFMVMPLLGGLAVWATYSLGRPLIGDAAALLAAALLATNPAFVLQLVHTPMSDIPATAWWTIALLLALRHDAASALGAGVATALGILTRPNLLPLAVVVGVALAIRQLRRPGTTAGLRLSRVLLFAAPAALGCLTVAYLNRTWYGSPLSSGYGQLTGELFKWEHFWPNVRQYGGTILLTVGPVSLLCVAGVVGLLRDERAGQRWRTVAYSAFAVAGYACYAFYFPYDTWWYLRFLFPILPVFYIFMVAGILTVDRWLPQGWNLAGALVLVIVTMATVISYSRSMGVLNTGIEERYETAGTFVRDHLPANAAVLSSLHSGSIRFYSGKLSVRFDFIPPERTQEVLAYLRSRGYDPWVVVDDTEQAEFNRRFGQTPFATQLSDVDAGIRFVRVYRVASD